MIPVPAPDLTETLRDYLHRHQVDAEHLRFLLESYLNQITEIPVPVDMMADLHREHRLWEYRMQLRAFIGLIEPREEAGNGDESDQTDHDDE